MPVIRGSYPPPIARAAQSQTPQQKAEVLMRRMVVSSSARLPQPRSENRLSWVNKGDL